MYTTIPDNNVHSNWLTYHTDAATLARIGGDLTDHPLKTWRMRLPTTNTTGARPLSDLPFAEVSSWNMYDRAPRSL